MAFADHPTLHPLNWVRDLRAQVPRKAVRDLLNRMRYGRDAPLSDELIHVDPLEVEYTYCGAQHLRRPHSGMIVPGDWDLERREIAKNTKLQSCVLHYEQGVPWRDTPLFARLMREVSEGKRPDDCGSAEELDARYAALDRVFEETRQRGRLLSRAELPDYFRREHGGILLHVARDGSLLRASGGAHRFAIARILKLPSMPAQLGAVHMEALLGGHLSRLRSAPQKT